MLKNKNKGITLIALVITIIILLILAGISISALSNQGLFGKAQEAKNKTAKAQENEMATLDEYAGVLNEYTAGKVTDNINKVLSTTDNTILKDENENKIVVPAGFKIVSNADTNNATTVDKGIVVEDATGTATNGSQFVWIPVGTIKKANKSTETIELNRYTFAEDGKPTAQNDNVILTYYQELASSNADGTTTYGNVAAKSITDFKTSVKTNGGYYIGRYEARTATARDALENALTQITEKGSEYIYNYVTQIQAAQQCQDMYTSTKFTSDLMNSYAWDTATLFLQKCGNSTTPYSRQGTLNTGSLATTGTNSDIQCNVHDMASNVSELTTETSGFQGLICTQRGGYYGGNTRTSSRSSTYYISYTDIEVGFRPILYVNV